MPFEFKNQSEYLLMRLSGECTGDETPSVLDVAKEQLKTSGLKFLIIQCADCSSITTRFLHLLGQVYKELKVTNSQVRLVGANEAVQNQIKNGGLDRILVNKMSLRGALVDFGLAKAKEVDVNFINPFLNATQKVLKVQCFIETKPAKPYLKKSTDPLLLGDVSGIISITSETFAGTLAISLSEEIFKKIATNMLGEPCQAISDDNVDLVGELANIILGQAKIELNGLGYAVQMALPSCIWGKDHKIKHFGSGICVVVPFETELGIIYTEITTNNGAMSELKDSRKKAA